MRQLLEELENLVRTGRHNEVKFQLSSLNSRQIPRELLSQFAHIAGRVRLPWLVLRWLNPVVRPKKLVRVPASPEELLEYAIALSQIGVHEEASQLLSDPSHPESPYVYRARAFSCIYRWDYDSAIPFLKKFVALEENPYQQVVGQLNLAAALLSVQDNEKSLKLLLELQEKLNDSSHSILRGNIEELLGQHYLISGNYELAKDHLRRGKDFFVDPESVYAFFIRKWEAILKLQESNSSVEAKAALEKVRVEAHKRKHFESLRECDLFEGICTSNHSLVERVFYGTPYAAYRRRIYGLWNQEFTQSSYVWTSGNSEAHVFDLQARTYGEREIHFNDQTRLINLIKALARDFYQPQTVGSLFSALYPGSYFDPLTSVNRVQKLISRVRKEMQHIPIGIINEKAGYLLQPIGCAIKVTIEPVLQESRYQRFLNQWPDLIRGTSFRLKEVVAVTGLPKSRVNRILKYGIESGQVQMDRSGTDVAYRFITSSNKLAA